MKVLRQAKQLALTGWINEEIKQLTKDEARDLCNKNLSALHDILTAPHASLALEVLQRVGFFRYILPEIQESLDLTSDKKFKKIWPHTLQVVNQTPPKLNLRWAALFHDLGKAQAFDIKKGKVTFHQHERLSAKIFNKFSKIVPIFGEGQRSCIHFLIANLGQVESYSSKWTDSAVRRFALEMDIYLEDLLQLSEADITTKNQSTKDHIVYKLKELKSRIEEVAKKDAQKELLPKGIGTVISQTFGIPVGPEIGKIRNNLDMKIKSGELLPNESFEYYISFLKKQKELDKEVENR